MALEKRRTGAPLERRSDSQPLRPRSHSDADDVTCGPGVCLAFVLGAVVGVVFIFALGNVVYAVYSR